MKVSRPTVPYRAADCEAAPVGDTDQRGDTRDAPSRDACDIGACDTGGA
jgi:hypothetical protein